MRIELHGEDSGVRAGVHSHIRGPRRGSGIHRAVLHEVVDLPRQRCRPEGLFRVSKTTNREVHHLPFRVHFRDVFIKGPDISISTARVFSEHTARMHSTDPPESRKGKNGREWFLGGFARRRRKARGRCSSSHIDRGPDVLQDSVGGDDRSHLKSPDLRGLCQNLIHVPCKVLSRDVGCKPISRGTRNSWRGRPPDVGKANRRHIGIGEV
mmetsp:Transcript_102271/g.327915  ORF Transcript_102271/g.327915 Transcript_102271/m.327915 type:complete len:210 (-) Transcript_102271:539-1168(-)